jgi:hypothetical protein
MAKPQDDKNLVVLPVDVLGIVVSEKESLQ